MMITVIIGIRRSIVGIVTKIAGDHRDDDVVT
jgi:hypothetical protein